MNVLPAPQATLHVCVYYHSVLRHGGDAGRDSLSLKNWKVGGLITRFISKYRLKSL